jgi:hypothetical protein
MFWGAGEIRALRRRVFANLRSLAFPFYDGVILSGLQAVKDLARIGRNSIYRLIHVLPFRRQVMPMRIQAFNHRYFFASSPTFDFFFAHDRIPRIGKHFVVDQASKVVAAGETGVELTLVFENPTRKVSRHSGVQGMGAWSVSHDVHVEMLRLSQRSPLMGSLIGPEAKVCDGCHIWTRNAVPMRARSFTRLKPGSG